MTQAPLSAPHTPQLTMGTLSWIWIRHLSSFLIPLTSLAFLLTGPHPWYIAPLFMLPPIFAVNLDKKNTVERRQPAPGTPAWPFDLIVYGLAAMHFYIIYRLAVLFTVQGLFSVDTVMVVAVVGGNSGFSIITAHELIHRRSLWERLLGRLMLCTVMQEHFYTEHLFGHHVRVGTPDDPATAQFGETYNAFYKRTVPAQFKSAWKLEARRLGDEEMSLFDPRMLRNRNIHGLLVEWGIAFAIAGFFGVVSFIVHLLQAFLSSRLLEAVNYMEHWGLRRKMRSVRPVDSWDTHSWFTYYGLTGLSRHADHHRAPARPYQELEIFEEAPQLPSGYLETVDMVIGRNDEFRQKAIAELRDRQLGPYDPDTPADEAARARETAEQILARETAQPGTLFGPDKAGRTGLRAVMPRLGWMAAFVLAVTTGVFFEAHSPTAFPQLLLRNAWIFVVFIGMLQSYRTLKKLEVNDSVAWSLAMALLVVVGVGSESLFGAGL